MTLCAWLMLFSGMGWAAPNRHLVGWTNVLLPGGGALLLGELDHAAEQFVLESSTFAWGYHLSARSPMTLDGVPEALPNPDDQILERSHTSKVCVKRDSKNNCTQYQNVTRTRKYSVVSDSPQDISRPLYADILQEIGLKAHMVNVFDYYRKSAAQNGVDLKLAQIDTHATSDLFLAPFSFGRVMDPWVSVPLGLTAVTLYVAYRASLNVEPLPPFTNYSTRLYEATYLGVFPLGSGAPEEMFYRGFLQSEVYALSQSPWLSIPVSTALYALSHSSDAQLGAAVSGLYLGYMTYHDRGDLRRGIAYHFWSDVMSGLYTIAILKLGQKQAHDAAPVRVSAQFEF